MPNRPMSPLRALHFLWQLVWTSFNKWMDDQCPRYGASLSYYAVLSLAPLLVILVGLIGLFFGEGAARAQLVAEATNMAGSKAGALVDVLLHAARRPAEGMLASVLALGMLVIGATGVLVELRDALDHIWLSKPVRTPTQPFFHAIWRVIRTRMLTFGILFAIGFLMIISLFVSAYLAAFDGWMRSQTSGVLALAKVLNPLLSFSILTFLFVILMLGLPSQRPAWRMVLPGAVLSALLFPVGKSLIGRYIGSTSATSAYGAAGSLVALMVWVYYSSQIVLLGAEFAWVLHNTPPGELPGSPAYEKIYRAATARRQGQLQALSQEEKDAAP